MPAAGFNKSGRPRSTRRCLSFCAAFRQLDEQNRSIRDTLPTPSMRERSSPPAHSTHSTRRRNQPQRLRRTHDLIGYLRLPLSWIAHSDRVGIPLMRVAIAIIFLWIGALKFAPYEADSITPFVANSPFMSLFYEHPAEYKAHLTHEGELKPAERACPTANNTYGV